MSANETIIIHDGHEYLVSLAPSSTLITEAINAAGCTMPAAFLNEIQQSFKQHAQ